MSTKQNNIVAALPVLFGFFVMGFCDIVGISSDYAASAFRWGATMAGLVPSAVFVWFFFLGVPVGLLMDRIGRKNTVLLSCAVTVVGMALPLVAYNGATTLAAYALLGIGNAILQVSLNPLLSNVVRDERLLTSALTAGQVVKALSSFAGPFLVLAAVNVLGDGDEQRWYLCFPIMGGITLLSGLWLLCTPIPKEIKNEELTDKQCHPESCGQGGSSVLFSTFALLRDPTLLVLFFGIFFAVGADVSTNFISSKVMIARYGYSKEMAGLAPQVYFVMRTVGAFFGVFMLTRIAAERYFRWNIVACIAAVVMLAVVRNDVANFLCLGAIGFCCACVFPIIFAQALAARPEAGNAVSGLMIMAVAGGTVSFVVGAATDAVGIAGGVAVILLEVLYLTFCAFRRQKA